MLILLLHLLHYATAPFAYLFFSFRAYIALSLSFFLYLFWLDLSLQYQINKGDFAFFCFFLCVFYFGNNWEKKKSKKRFGFGLCFSFYHLTSTCYTISLSARRAKKNGHVAMYCSCWWFHVYTLIYGLSQKIFPGYFFFIILMKELFMRMFPRISIPGWDEWLTYNCGTWNVISIGLTKGLWLHMEISRCYKLLQ